MRRVLLKANVALWLVLAQTWMGPAGCLGQSSTVVYHSLASPYPSPDPPPWDDSGVPIGSALTLDFNSDGQPDVGFYNDGMVAEIYGFGATRILTYPPAGLDINSFLPVLAAGTEIGPTPTNQYLIWRETIYLDRPYSATYNGVWNVGYGGYWQGVEGYTGVEFYIGNEPHYAWIRVGAPFRGLQGGYVRGYAYETRANTPILAGAGEPPPTRIEFTASFSGANEIPSNTSTHSGHGSIAVDLRTNLLTYSLALDFAFRPTAASILGPSCAGSISRHEIADLGSYMIMPPIPLGPGIYEPFPGAITYFGHVVLTKQEMAQLMAGQLNVNFTSTAFPRGEVRGAVLPVAPIQFTASLSGANGIPRHRRPNEGAGVFVLRGNTLAHHLALDADLLPLAAGIYGEPPPRARHANLIHALDLSLGVLIPEGGIAGEPGVAGQVLYTGEVNLTDQQVCQLKQGDLYADISTGKYLRGEMTGHILPMDSDQDGLPDYINNVIGQLCPCDGPWTSHAQYVGTVRDVASAFAAARLITIPQFLRLLHEAQRSNCGK